MSLWRHAELTKWRCDDYDATLKQIGTVLQFSDVSRLTLPLVSSSSSLGSQLVSRLEVAFYELSWLHRLSARAHLSAISARGEGWRRVNNDATSYLWRGHFFSPLGEPPCSRRLSQNCLFFMTPRSATFLTTIGHFLDHDRPLKNV